MKLPKLMKRHCPYCNKHTEHKVSISKKRARNATHPLSWGSKHRTAGRGARAGTGNLGKYSKPPISKWKRVGKKLTQKTDLRYQCQVCQKMHCQSKGIRVKKLELI